MKSIRAYSKTFKKIKKGDKTNSFGVLMEQPLKTGEEVLLREQVGREYTGNQLTLIITECKQIRCVPGLGYKYSVSYKLYNG